jgi:hypothetical protein
LKLRSIVGLEQLHVLFKANPGNIEWTSLEGNSGLKMLRIDSFPDATAPLTAFSNLTTLESVELNEFGVLPNLDFVALSGLNLKHLALHPLDYSQLVKRSEGDQGASFDNFILFDFSVLENSTALTSLSLGLFSYKNHEKFQDIETLDSLSLEFTNSRNSLSASNTSHQVGLLEKMPENVRQLRLENADFTKISLTNQLDSVRELTLVSCSGLGSSAFKAFIIGMSNLESIRVRESFVTDLDTLLSPKGLNELVIIAGRPSPISEAEVQQHQQRLDQLSLLEIPVLDSESSLNLFDFKDQSNTYRFRVVD